MQSYIAHDIRYEDKTTKRKLKIDSPSAQLMA